jgi:class 3 adenylate cyclase
MVGNFMNTPRYPEERRLATVLFADVHGFTALAEQLDYETVSDLIKSIWKRLDAVIEENGGYIDKHMGDGVMAVWGAPFAGDDDAEQAVTAALAMQTALKDLAAHSLVPGATQLQLRLGVNSGSVFAGYLGSRDEYTVIGDTVNVASRFEQTADPGTVVIGESTFRLVRGAFRVRRLSPLNLKGKTEPIEAFLVEGAAPSGGRGRYRGGEGLATYMVGRTAELEQLAQIHSKFQEDSSPTMVLVTGEAGLGKSRLLMEFTSQLEINNPASLIGNSRALAQAERIPFYLWKGLWYNWFGITSEDDAELTRDKFIRELSRLWGKQLSMSSPLEAAHLIGNLCGLEWPESRYLMRYPDAFTRIRRAFELTRELLQRVTVLRPVILWFDDLQWADKSSLELLQFLLEPGEACPALLVLAGARDDFLRQPGPALALTNIASRISLHAVPFTAESVAAAYPDLRHWLPAVLTELAQRCEGNPYFLEEMVKGLLKGSAEHANPNDQLAFLQANPPESLRAMLQARLDDLPREARAIALLASVVGRVFWVGAVAAEARASSPGGTGLLASAPSAVVERLIQDSLRHLVRAELAFPRVSSHFSNEQEYIFKHSLLRDVAYSLIPNKYLPQYHLAVARWLATRPEMDFVIMAAEHFELAGAYREAARQYDQAAHLSNIRGGTSEALALTNKAVELKKKAKEAGE